MHKRRLLCVCIGLAWGEHEDSMGVTVSVKS